MLQLCACFPQEGAQLRRVFLWLSAVCRESTADQCLPCFCSCLELVALRHLRARACVSLTAFLVLLLLFLRFPTCVCARAHQHASQCECECVSPSLSMQPATLQCTNIERYTVYPSYFSAVFGVHTG